MRVLILSLVSLSGCANTHAYVALDAHHSSHISQHFEKPATNYGYDAIEASFRVERAGAFAEVSEGYILEPRWHAAGIAGAGAMLGPSEVTQFSVGYHWRVW